MEMVSLPISLSTLDHELRIPLTGILGLARFLSEEPLTPTQKEYIEGILESGKRLLALANTLSAGSKKIKANEQNLTSTSRVLLVEDDPVVQLVHKKMLMELGCHVDVASTGQKALEMVDNEYDTVFMDVGLPDMTGIEASAKIRQREANTGKSTRIIALTGYTQEEIYKECLAAGVNEVATKPIAADKLKKLMEVEKHQSFCTCQV